MVMTQFNHHYWVNAQLIVESRIWTPTESREADHYFPPNVELGLFEN